MASSEIVISRRFRGPPDSANGGYACGVITIPQAEGEFMFIYAFLLAVVLLLAAILSAMKFGFNQVVTGLQAIHTELLRQERPRSP